jgi:hypothetical protein
LTLPVNERGAMESCRALWEDRVFDFEDACRRHGRNNAFWILCYRRRLDGIELPGGPELRRLTKIANRATAGRNTDGELERYTRHEAQATVDQVSSYPCAGLRPMAERLRRWAKESRSRRASATARAIAVAMADIAEQAGRHDFTASTRQIAAMAGTSAVQVSRYMHVLVDAGLVTRKGYCRPRGYAMGTSKFSIHPRRPVQRIDEAERPRYDALRARWTWRKPSLRGQITSWQWLHGSVPNVTTSSSSTRKGLLVDAFRASTELHPSRGSPLLEDDLEQKTIYVEQHPPGVV